MGVYHTVKEGLRDAINMSLKAIISRGSRNWRAESFAPGTREIHVSLPSTLQPSSLAKEEASLLTIESPSACYSEIRSVSSQFGRD